MESSPIQKGTKDSSIQDYHGLKPLVYAHIFEIIFIEFGINTRLAVGIQEP